MTLVADDIVTMYIFVDLDIGINGDAAVDDCWWLLVLMLVSTFFIVFDVNNVKTTHYIGLCAFGNVFLYLYLNQIRKKVYISDCTECSTGLLGLVDTCRDQPIQKYESLLRCTQWDLRFSAARFFQR